MELIQTSDEKYYLLSNVVSFQYYKDEKYITLNFMDWESYTIHHSKKPSLYDRVVSYFIQSLYDKIVNYFIQFFQ